MQRLKFVLAGLLFASPAFAQDAPVVEGEASAEANAGAEVNAGGAGAGAEGAVDATMAAGLSTMWPLAAGDRPYVIPQSMFAAYGNYTIGKLTIPNFIDPTMPGTSITFDGLTVGGAYGVADKINAGLQYSFGTGIIGDNDFAIGEGQLDLFGGFQLVHDGKMSVTATAAFSLDLCGSQDMDGCVLTKGLTAGLGARYNVAPKIGIFTGDPYGPGPVGRHLSISLESSGPITFDVPVGGMFQATPELNVHLATTLTRIAISNAGETTFFGADYIPVTLGGLFALSKNLDLTASFQLPDMKEAQFDLFFFLLGARYYGG